MYTLYMIIISIVIVFFALANILKKEEIKLRQEQLNYEKNILIDQEIL